MFDKTFISLYFTEKSIYLLGLDSKKRKVIKKYFVNIPDGIVSKNRVTDKKSLTAIIKGIWETNRIGEKALSLIIPEYTTFTKVISVPTLIKSELDEAVRWEAQEYLPQAITNMILDWKTVEKGDDQTKVLIAAIEKDVLSGFVDSAESAGLFPLAVETPSLSLSRFVGKGNDDGRLVIYGNGEEYLFTVSKGETIYGTTISKLESPDTLAKTAVRMSNHYKDASVTEITLAGVGISERLVSNIKSELKVDVNWINPKILGLTEREVQEYIVPICMQFSEPEDPLDQFSLNLLPERLVTKYKKEKGKLQIWSLTLTVTLFVWISLLLTLGSYLILNTQINDARSQNALKVSVANEREMAIKDVNYINDLSGKVLKLKKLSVTPGEIINQINASSPGGLIINHYKFALDVGRIEFEGVSPNRANLLELKANLEKDENIGEVEIPISSFEKEANLEFKVSYDYLPISSQILKKK
jgi:hypothetical protein